ncbi:MAG: type II toxin-antitoxin system RelE/ParE family toxin [Chromatiaceae bacterium]|nr:type II toxin-antitoxin system RelE/ParE family toxin [Chromatiaceae bacterium]
MGGGAGLCLPRHPRPGATDYPGQPTVGHCRPEFSAQHRIFPAGRHIIVYRVTTRAILVSRILHGRMDLGGDDNL